MSRITRSPGFTVLELVVVMAVIVILAAIAIPVALSAQREASEAKLLANLNVLRGAINRFAADCGGYPAKIEDLIATEPPRSCYNMEDGSRMRIDPADFRGPYVYTPDEGFPKDPITKKREWSYDRGTGHVSSSAKGKTLDGIRYKDL